MVLLDCWIVGWHGWMALLDGFVGWYSWIDFVGHALKQTASEYIVEWHSWLSLMMHLEETKLVHIG